MLRSTENSFVYTCSILGKVGDKGEKKVKVGEHPEMGWSLQSRWGDSHLWSCVLQRWEVRKHAGKDRLPGDVRKQGGLFLKMTTFSLH